MRRLSLRKNSYGLFGNAPALDAQQRAEQEQAALAQGMSLAEWQVEQQSKLEQKILGLYNAALSTLNGAGLPIENVEEGNALIAFLVENQTTHYSDSDIIDLIKDIRSKIQSGEIQAKVAFADKGRDVRPALYKLATEVGTDKSLKIKAAYLYRLLEVIREEFYLQMILTMQGKPRSLQRDADIQKQSIEAIERGKELGLQIETEYTLQMFDKAERLVAENLNTITFNKDDLGLIYKSSDPTVDGSMTILSAESNVSKDLFDKLISQPRRDTAIRYGMIGLGLGFLFSQLKKRSKK